MDEIVRELKAWARVLHGQVKNQEPAALARVRRLPELQGLEDAAVSREVKRRHCLAVVARELGFAGWPHAREVLTGASDSDFGTLLCPPECFAHWNIWSASYEEARSIRSEHGGYLLAYKRHFFIVDRFYIESLGLDPEDADWERIGRDWVRPAQPEARGRLYTSLIRSRRPPRTRPDEGREGRA